MAAQVTSNVSNPNYLQREERELEIRRSTESDNAGILNIHTQAFGEKKGPEIADLVSGLLDDKTALPLLSLVAVDNAKTIGQVNQGIDIGT